MVESVQTLGLFNHFRRESIVAGKIFLDSSAFCADELLLQFVVISDFLRSDGYPYVVLPNPSDVLLPVVRI